MSCWFSTTPVLSQLACLGGAKVYIPKGHLAKRLASTWRGTWKFSSRESCRVRFGKRSFALAEKCRLGSAFFLVKLNSKRRLFHEENWEFGPCVLRQRTSFRWRKIWNGSDMFRCHRILTAPTKHQTGSATKRCLHGNPERSPHRLRVCTLLQKFCRSS